MFILLSKNGDFFKYMTVIIYHGNMGIFLRVIP